MKLVASVFCVLWALSVSGERRSDYDLEDAPDVVSSLLEKHLNGLESGLARSSHARASVIKQGDSPDVGFYLQRFLFRIQPFVTFDVGVVNLKVSPFFEVRVRRTPPKGGRITILKQDGHKWFFSTFDALFFLLRSSKFRFLYILFRWVSALRNFDNKMFLVFLVGCLFFRGAILTNLLL